MTILEIKHVPAPFHSLFNGWAKLQRPLRTAGRYLQHAQLPSSQDRLCLGTPLVGFT